MHKEFPGNGPLWEQMLKPSLRTDRKKNSVSLCRSKLILTFLGICLLLCGLDVIGGQFLYKTVHHEATNRVRSDLGTAREIYLNRVKGIKVGLNIAALGPEFRSAVEKRNAREIILC